MLRKATLFFLVSACALALGGGTAAAANVARITVCGTQTTGGEPVPGVAQMFAGPLTNCAGTEIGRWQALTLFTGPASANVEGRFSVWGGILLVRGTFNPNLGAPSSLDVYAGFGRFRGATGTLAVAFDIASGETTFAFAFVLRRGMPWHP